MLYKGTRRILDALPTGGILPETATNEQKAMIFFGHLRSWIHKAWRKDWQLNVEIASTRNKLNIRRPEHARFIHSVRYGHYDHTYDRWSGYVEAMSAPGTSMTWTERSQLHAAANREKFKMSYHETQAMRRGIYFDDPAETSDTFDALQYAMLNLYPVYTGVDWGYDNSIQEKQEKQKSWFRPSIVEEFADWTLEDHKKVQAFRQMYLKPIANIQYDPAVTEELVRWLEE